MTTKNAWQSPAVARQVVSAVTVSALTPNPIPNHYTSPNPIFRF